MFNFYKYFVVLFFFLQTNIVLCQKNSFTINGSINQPIAKGMIFIYYINHKGDKIIDSVKVENSNFFIKGFINSPTKAFIGNNAQFRLDDVSARTIYLEPKILTISVDFYNFKTLVLNDSKTNNEYLSLVKRQKINSVKRDSIYKLKNELTNKIVPEKEIKMELFDIEIEKYYNNDIDIEFDFINENPNSFINPDLLLFRLRRRGGILLYEKLNALYNKLSADVKNSITGKKLNETLTNYINSKIGSYAPDFSLKNVNDSIFNLKSFRNKKYVLIDFWASWCMPCREDFKFLKEYYKKYKNIEFEIIGISRDEKIESWKKALKSDNISWINASIKQYDSNIEDEYFVTAIPVKILIDKNGIIIGRWRGGGDENKKEIQKKLEEIFEIK